MTVSVAYFKINYPEFRETKDSLVQAKINSATKRIAAPTWGDRANDGVMLLTAHLLSLSPSGEHARLKKEDDMTIYSAELQRMRRAVTMGVDRVT